MRKDILLLIVLGVGMVFFANYKAEELPTHFISSVVPMDHEPTDTFVRNVLLNGNWIGSAGSGGSTALSGINLPLKWYPGLTAHVKWERCQPYGQDCVWTEKTVFVHPYDDVGETWLHIIDGLEVLLVPIMLAPRHENYPGPLPPYKNFHKKRGISR